MSWKSIYAIQDGIKVDFESLAVHPFSAGIAFGATLFECLRAYKAYDGTINVFRLDDHINRLTDGMKFMRFTNGPSVDTLASGILDSVRINPVDDDAYIRIHVYLADQTFAVGLAAATNSKIGWSCGSAYRARSKLYHNGSTMQVSSWMKTHDISAPPRIKATANYHMARIALLQAKADGYDNAIFLNKDGKLCEATGAAIALIKDGVLITPSTTSDILESITTDAVLSVAKDIGIPIQQRIVDRTEIYNADEIFICGTGAEVEPVISIDRHPIGDGKPGRFTRMLQIGFEDIVRGNNTKYSSWLTPV